MSIINFIDKVIPIINFIDNHFIGIVLGSLVLSSSFHVTDGPDDKIYL